MIVANGQQFEAGCDIVEVTSAHRPDTSWIFTDGHGHKHRWHTDGKPAEHYRVSSLYVVPTIRFELDEWGYFEDGERYPIGHHECVQCGEHVEPRYTADDTRQYVPGLRWFRINGHFVSRDEFEQQAKVAGLL